MNVLLSAICICLTTTSLGVRGEIIPCEMKNQPEKQTTVLRIKVKPIAYAKGQIHVGLFRDAKSFPKKELAFAGKEVAVRQLGEIEIEMEGLVPGRYAAAVFHDLNGNGKLDTNLLGVPTEPYGFSNINSAKWGSPDFAEASFNLPAEGKTMEVRLAAWKDQ